MEQESAIHKAANLPEPVTAFGRQFQIREFALGKMIRALPHIAPLGYLLRSATNKADATDLLVSALTIAGEPALGLISVAIEEPIEYLEDKDPIEGLELLTAVIERNADYFFVPEKLERIKAAFARIESLIQRHGGDISTSSPGMDTEPLNISSTPIH